MKVRIEMPWLQHGEHFIYADFDIIPKVGEYITIDKKHITKVAIVEHFVTDGKSVSVTIMVDDAS